MKRDIIVAENFYINLDKIREYAINELKNNSYDAYPHYTKQIGKIIWKSSNWKAHLDCPFKSSRDLIAKLENLTGEKIDLNHWNAPFPGEWPIQSDHPRFLEYKEKAHKGEIGCKWNCAFQLKIHGGDSQKHSVHTHAGTLWDDVTDDGWAGLIYLNPNAKREAGLYTWKNKKGDDYRYMTRSEEWELEDQFCSTANRLILIRGKKPHSGGDGWTDIVEEGRIFQTFFFRTKSSDTIESVNICLDDKTNG